MEAIDVELLARLDNPRNSEKSFFFETVEIVQLALGILDAPFQRAAGLGKRELVLLRKRLLGLYPHEERLVLNTLKKAVQDRDFLSHLQTPGWKPPRCDLK